MLLAKAAAVRKSASPERLPDLAYLNAVCRALDAADGFYASSAEAKILVKSSLAAARIVISDRRPPAAEQPAIPGHGTVQVFHDGNDAAAPFRVVVIGRPGSLYTAVSLQLLQRVGVTVSALVAVTGPAQRRLVDRDRTYSRRVPLARWAHVLPFAHRARFNNRKASPALLSYARELGVGWRAMTSLNSGSGIQLLQVGTLADLRILELLERTRPHALVYTGGGVVPPAVIARAGHGVVNAHNAILPDYRGLDAPFWAMLKGRADRIGIIGHLMDQGIDTGPILRVRRVEAAGFATPHALDAELWAALPVMLVEATMALRDGAIAERQSASTRQYFRLHPRLRTLVLSAMPAIRSHR